MKFLRLFTIQILFVLIAATPVAASTQENDWAKSISIQQLKELAMHKANEVEPLKSIWSLPEIAGLPSHQAVYWGGGRLRGLLNWIDQKLKENSYEAVWRMRPPTIDELNPISIGKTDKDLFIANPDVKELLEARGLKGWDLLPPEAMIESITVGGSSIEKLMMSSKEIRDPMNAFDDFYRGQLEFSNGITDSLTKVIGEGNSTFGNNNRISLILRALRHSLDIPRMKISPRTWTQLRALVKKDKSSILENDYGIEKHLTKLYLALGQDERRLYEYLSRAGLLEVLANKKYKIRPSQFGGTKPDLPLRFIQSWYVGRARLDKAQTRVEFFSILEKLAQNPSWVEGLGNAVRDSFQYFLNLDGRPPTQKEVSYLLEIAKGGAHVPELVDYIFGSVNKKSEYLFWTEEFRKHLLQMKRYGAYWYREVAFLSIQHHIGKFTKMKPTAEEWQKFIRDAEYKESANVMINVLEALAEEAKTPKELVDAFMFFQSRKAWPMNFPNEREKLILRFFSKANHLNLSLKELGELFRTFSSNGDNAGVFLKLIQPKLKSKEHLIEVVGAEPKRGYTSAVKELLLNIETAQPVKVLSCRKIYH